MPQSFLMIFICALILITSQSHADQPITCRAGNICTYPDGTVVQSGPPLSRSNTSSAHSKPDSTDLYVLDGRSYTRDALISDFLRISFPSHLWFTDDFGTQTRFQFPAITTTAHVAETFWFAEYLNRSKGLPPFDALNRWNTNVVTIGLDWPPGTWPPGDPAHYDLISDQIKLLASGIEKATGLHIKLLMPSEETPDSFARLRIVTNALFGGDNQFKHPLKHTGGLVDGAITMPIAATPSFEERLFGLVPFTPSAPTQVEGYVVPEVDNTIGFAVCKISPVHEQHMQATLATECLVRALGLPEKSLTNDHTILGEWNRSQFWTSPQVKLDEYASFMLSVLYCADLKSGMSRYDVLLSLYKSDTCFKYISQSK